MESKLRNELGFPDSLKATLIEWLFGIKKLSTGECLHDNLYMLVFKHMKEAEMLGSLGGKKTLEKYGKSHFSEIGKKGRKKQLADKKKTGKHLTRKIEGV